MYIEGLKSVAHEAGTLALGQNNNTVIIPFQAIQPGGGLVETMLVRDALTQRAAVPAGK